MDTLLTEADDVVVRRSAAKEAVAVLRAAVAALEEVPSEMLVGASGGHASANGISSTSTSAANGVSSNIVNPFTAAVAAADAAAATAHPEGLTSYLASSVRLLSPGTGASSLPPASYTSGASGFGSPGYTYDGISMDRLQPMVAAANMVVGAPSQLHVTTLRTPEGF